MIARTRTEGAVPRETRSWHGSEVNTGSQVSDLFVLYCTGLLRRRGRSLQKPVSRPTAKQLASWLKAADKATGLLSRSIAGLVFMTVSLRPDDSFLHRAVRMIRSYGGIICMRSWTWAVES